MHPYSIIKLDTVDSTNNWAKKALLEGALSTNAVIVADTQTQGRGQMRTMWHDEPRTNLLMSLVYHPQKLSANDFFRLNEAVSLALIDLLKILGFKEAEIKWPNDILLRGSKVAGILIETTVSANCISRAIVGIGLNVNQKQFNPAFKATSLSNEASTEFNREATLIKLLGFLNARLAQIQSPANKADYKSSLYGVNKILRFSDEKGTFSGMVIGVNDQGELLLKVDNEPTLRTYRFKEVKWLL